MFKYHQLLVGYRRRQFIYSYEGLQRHFICIGPWIFIQLYQWFLCTFHVRYWKSFHSVIAGKFEKCLHFLEFFIARKFIDDTYCWISQNIIIIIIMNCLIGPQAAKNFRRVAVITRMLAGQMKL